MGGDNSSLFKKRVSSPLYNTVANIYTYTEAKKINSYWSGDSRLDLGWVILTSIPSPLVSSNLNILFKINSNTKLHYYKVLNPFIASSVNYITPQLLTTNIVLPLANTVLFFFSLEI